MSVLVGAIPFILVVGGLLALAYASAPTARKARLQRSHAREMRAMREVLPARSARVEYAAR